jgi:hypothetical protein
VELEITPEPTDDERAAILAALAGPVAEAVAGPVAEAAPWREDEPEP